MGIKDTIEKRQGIVTGIAFIVLALASFAIYAQFRKPSQQPIPGAIYYDLSTQQTFTATTGQRNPLPPIEAPSGPFNGKPGGVRAWVYACGDCRVEANRQIVWLDQFTESAVNEYKWYDAVDDLDDSKLAGQRWVKRPGDAEWTDAYSDKGYEIRASASCPNGTPVLCGPLH